MVRDHAIDVLPCFVECYQHGLAGESVLAMLILPS